jgi:hypothetical protein
MRGSCLEHQLTAPPHEKRGSRQANRISRVVRGELAEGMSGCSAHMRVKGFLCNRPDCGSVREESGLRVLCGSKLLSRSFEAEPTDVGAKCGIDFSEDAARHGKCFGEIFSHPRLLRALAWEKEYYVHR